MLFTRQQGCLLGFTGWSEIGITWLNCVARRIVDTFYYSINANGAFVQEEHQSKCNISLLGIAKLKCGLI